MPFAESCLLCCSRWLEMLICSGFGGMVCMSPEGLLAEVRFLDEGLLFSTEVKFLSLFSNPEGAIMEFRTIDWFSGPLLWLLITVNFLTFWLPLLYWELALAFLFCWSGLEFFELMWLKNSKLLSCFLSLSTRSFSIMWGFWMMS